jgi:hypothetical protein
LERMSAWSLTYVHPRALTLPSAAQEDVAGHAIPVHLRKDAGSAFRTQAG